MKESSSHINDDLLINYLLGEATHSEMISVENWLESDPGNRVYFEKLRSIWDKSRQVVPVTEADEEEAWKRFQLRIHAGNRSRFTKPVKRLFWMRYAAIFILIAGISLLSYLLVNRVDSNSVITASTTDRVLMDTLSDGSVVTLNKNSSVTYPKKFKGNTRTVQLKGEAFFNVTSNRKKPFMIHVNDVSITVVGTSFNVRSINGKTEVIVESGVVRVTRNHNTVELRPQEKVSVNARDSIMKKEKEKEHLYNYYLSHEFVCDGTPLWKLVEVLNEAYEVNITIGRRDLRTAPLTVTFSNESLDHILEVLAMTLNAKVIRSGNEIILR